MTERTRFLAVSCILLMVSGTASQAQEACQTYVVKPGDNLRRIARSAYGSGDMYRVIYDANVARIGGQADVISVGSTLEIPCDPNAPAVRDQAPAESGTAGEALAAPGADTLAAPVAEVVVAAGAAAPLAAPGQKAIGFVTGNDYAPFADESLPGGGIFTQLVEMAIFRADAKLPYSLTFINDWQAHIDALLPSQAYDISFPWQRPDCEGTEMLSPNDAYRCENLVFSDPFIEVVDGFFARSDSDLVQTTSTAGFAGKRICRPEGYTTGVLDALGLGVPTIKLMQPEKSEDCFNALMQDQADLVSIDVDVGLAKIAAMGLSGAISQNPYLTEIQTLHAIADKSNPAAVATIEMLNSGLTEMYKSGEWFDIVSAALAQKAAIQ